MAGEPLDFVSVEQAADLLRGALSIAPISITRQSLTESGNAVFRIELKDQPAVVLRVSPRAGAFKYTAKNLEVLRELGLPVQRVLGWGSTPAGGSFIILNWIPGRDLIHELHPLTGEQMSVIARSVTDIQKRVGTLPVNQGFGWASIGGNPGVPRWTEIFGPAEVGPSVIGGGIVEQLKGRLRALRQSVEPYFNTVRPICFLDDLTIKNVLIENGKLTGVIDVDVVCYGDPLMSVGTTLALLAEIGKAGDFYGQELVRCWNPSAEQLRAIGFYSALWMVGMLSAAQSNGDAARVEKLSVIADAMLRMNEPASSSVSQVDADQVLALATEQHRAGNLTRARQMYQKVLEKRPDHGVGRFRLGLLELQCGELAAALKWIEPVAKQWPGEARYQFGLAEVFTAMKCWKEAAAAYRRVVGLDSKSADGFQALGNALQMMGNHLAAIDAYRSAVRIHPDLADAWNNLGAALCQQREYLQAETVLRGLLGRQPNHAPATYNLGNALYGLGQQRAAAEQFEKAIVLRPEYVDALNNLGNVRKELGELELAASAYESALRIDPDSVAAINNTGCLLRTRGQLDEAENILRQGLIRCGEHPAFFDNLGNVLKDAGRLEEAIECFRQAMVLDPAAAATHSNLVYSLGFNEIEGEPILEESRRWSDQHIAPLRWRMPLHLNERSSNRRLKIGYVSPDFRDHCQSLFTIPLLSHHDHEKFEIHCYSSVERKDHLTRRIAEVADVWRDVRPLDDSALCEVIRGDGIDVLVDLTMHMAGGRPMVFARKPAPVQIAWLAYPGTTGMAAMDYRLSDPRLDPPGSEKNYSERTIHLPDSFWCYDPLTDGPEVNELPALSRGHLTLGCLNNPCKLTDPALKLWASVLSALPSARLLLMTPPGSPRQQLLGRAVAAGLAVERIDFVGYRPRGEYLQTYHQIDLGLDTFPYNGHTTSLDSFWMGVPVVTRFGQTCVGRGGLSQLHQLDLLDLAAENDGQFISRAIELASDLPRLAQLRRELRPRIEASPLMDGQRFARNIETVYRQVWDSYCRDAPR